MAPPNLSLFTVQCKAGEESCHTQEIIRYDFKNGELTAKETILSMPIEEARFDLGENIIYQNRYIISGFGDIFDIRTRQVLGDGRGFLVDIVENNVIVEENKIDLEGFFAFNLETKKYRKLPPSNVFESDGKLSPNKKRFASWSFQNGFQFDEVEHWKSIRKTKINGYFIASCSMRCSSSMKVPFVWIDNDRILTQKSNGEIISINVSGKIEKITNIKIDETPDSLPFIERDEFGNFSYYCNGTTYSIDLVNKTYTKDKAILGNNFESIHEEVFWAEYFYQGKSIGRVWSGDSSTYKGFLAMQYAKEGKNLGYPDGIKVWNDLKNDWITIEINWGVKIIGWIES